MAKYLIIAGLVFYLTILPMGCTYKQQNLPAQPDQVRGWKEKVFDGIYSVAELVLYEGKSSDGGELGVEVMSISPYETRGGFFDHPAGPEAMLRFYNVSDHQVVQDKTVFVGGANLDGSRLSEPAFGIKGIYVNAINTKERWVWFDLRR